MSESQLPSPDTVRPICSNCAGLNCSGVWRPRRPQLTRSSSASRPLLGRLTRFDIGRLPTHAVNLNNFTQGPPQFLHRMENSDKFHAQRINTLPFADRASDLVEATTDCADFCQAAIEQRQFLERHRWVRTHVGSDQGSGICGVFHATPLSPQSKPVSTIAGTQPQRDAITLLRFALTFVAGLFDRIALQHRIDEQPEELGLVQATTARKGCEPGFPVGRGPGGNLLPDGSARIHLMYKYMCVIFV